ncbi:hypothetical protein BDB01DRAFT_794145 [Pilobolus umbonatus]|nr:hypothetical protein BDB01DRAFT_794145 [Pilobolus umbonatus]
MLKSITQINTLKALSAQSSRRAMSSFSHMSDNDPEVLEKEKQKNLKTDKKEWNEKLASHSEAAVKADKQHNDKSIKDLQSETVDTLKE